MDWLIYDYPTGSFFFVFVLVSWLHVDLCIMPHWACTLPRWFLVGVFTRAGLRVISLQPLVHSRIWFVLLADYTSKSHKHASFTRCYLCFELVTLILFLLRMRLNLDISYVDHWSICGIIYFLFRTLNVVFARNVKYGPREWRDYRGLALCKYVRRKLIVFRKLYTI